MSALHGHLNIRGRDPDLIDPEDLHIPNTADVIAARLHDAGCRRAFGIPGGEVLSLVEGLTGAGIEFSLAKHENAAGFMAEGASHATGAPGILVATLGPGVANAINVVANAWQDRVPLIFLTGCVDAADALTYTHQVFDHTALTAPVTLATFRLAENTADVVMDKALRLALGDPPGPVHIDVPISVAATEHRAASMPAWRVERAGPVAGPALETARTWFSEARKPLLIAGLEAMACGAEAVVEALATTHGIPLITTYKAKGVLSEDHPLSLGGAGLSPKADQRLLPLVAEADLVILAGYDPIEMRTGWRDPFSSASRVIEFSLAPATHGMHAADASFVGDIGAGLRALSDGVAPTGSWSAGEPANVRANLHSAFAGNGEWGPEAIIATAREVLPADTVATVDSGAHRILLSQMWQCYTPRTLLQSTGLCTMGCALPLAIGYKMAAPGRPVVAFTGDAGLEMVLGELATLRDSGLPVITIVFVDESLALIELKQRRSGMANAAVDFGATDFVRLAESLALRAAWVDDSDTLRRELNAALNEPRGTVLACRIGRHRYDNSF